MPDTVKRLNYYDHQFLRVPDFTDEQKYNLSMRRLHNSSLHTWGIVQGLQVAAAGGGTGFAVTVNAGVAMDSTGREMVLPADTNLELSGEAGTFYITIAYDEQQSDPTTEAGGPGNTRITELPRLSFSKNEPADASMTLILAMVQRAGTGLGPVDGSKRKQAGGVLGSDLTINTLTLKKDGIAQANWPVLSCSAANQVNLANAGLVVNGLVGIGTVTPNKDLTISRTGAQLGVFASMKNSNHEIVVGVDGVAIVSAMTASDLQFRTNNAMRFVVKANSGNIGINTNTPEQQLTIAGTGAETSVFTNLRNSNHELLMGVGGVAVVSAMTATDLELRTNNTMRVVVKANTGNVGIGTWTPGTILEVNKNQNAHTELRVLNSDTGPAAAAYVLVGSVAAGGTYGCLGYFGSGYKTDGVFQARRTVLSGQDSGGLHLAATHASGAMTFITGGWATGNERMRIDAAGNVGIGTTSPAKPLDVAGSGGIRISQTGAANSTNEILFQDNGQIRSFDDNHRIIFDRANNILELREYGDLVFSPGATSSARTQTVTFKSGGNVGIGTASPLAFLHVETGGTNNSALILTRTASKPAFGILPWESQIHLSAGITYQNSAWVHQSDTNDNLILTLDPGAGVKWYASNNGSGSWNVASNVSQWDTAGYWKNLVQSTAPGNSYFTGGNVGIGTSTPVAKLDVRAPAQFTSLSFGDATGVWYKDNWLGMADNLDAVKTKWLHIGGITDNADGLGAKRRLGLFADQILLTGKVVSPMWKVTHVMNQKPGPFPFVSTNIPTFASGGGTLMIIFSGSGYSSAGGNIGMTLQVDGTNVANANARCYTNEVGSHKAFNTNFIMLPNVAAGNHTVNFVAMAGTSTLTDGNDYFSVTVLELPI
jgi:hypothetical protein